MLEIQKIRQDAQPFIDGLKNRNIKDAAEKIEQLLTLDQNRRDSITELEQLRNTMNQSSKSIGKLMKEGKKEEAGRFFHGYFSEFPGINSHFLTLSIIKNKSELGCTRGTVKKGSSRQNWHQYIGNYWRTQIDVAT